MKCCVIPTVPKNLQGGYQQATDGIPLLPHHGRTEKNKVHIEPTPAKKARIGVKREQSPSKIGKLKRLVPQQATARKPKLEAWTPGATPSPLKKKEISKQHSQVTTSNRKPYKRKNSNWVHVKNWKKKQDQQ